MAAPAASAAPSLTVTPDTDLVIGEVVDVYGAGFQPDTSYEVCQTTLGARPSIDTCPPGRNDGMSSPTGELLLEIEVQKGLFVGDGVDCGVEQCAIAAARSDGLGPTVSAPTVGPAPEVRVGRGRPTRRPPPRRG